jgi:hypothetical protein
MILSIFESPRKDEVSGTKRSRGVTIKKQGKKTTINAGCKDYQCFWTSMSFPNLEERLLKVFPDFPLVDVELLLIKVVPVEFSPGAPTNMAFGLLVAALSRDAEAQRDESGRDIAMRVVTRERLSIGLK